MQVFREVEYQSTEPCIEGCFSCSSIGILLDDIQRFSVKHDLQLHSLDNEKNSDNPSIGNVLGELFRNLNSSKHQETVKCLVFDDAELSTSIIKHIDEQICADMVKHRLQQKWRIIVTTRHIQHDQWLDQCCHLGIINFHHIEVFTKVETRLYMSQISSLDTIGKDILHHDLAGLPLALRITKQYLQSNAVSRQRRINFSRQSAKAKIIENKFNLTSMKFILMFDCPSTCSLEENDALYSSVLLSGILLSSQTPPDCDPYCKYL